jgi:hypothetical protein
VFVVYEVVRAIVIRTGGCALDGVARRHVVDRGAEDARIGAPGYGVDGSAGAISEDEAVAIVPESIADAPAKRNGVAVESWVAL